MKRIVVRYEPGASTVALMEDGQLAEFFVEQPEDRERAGNIYKGRVVNVLPGMQAAFVDIGLKKNAFLYIDDLLPVHLEKKPKVKPSITELVKEGQELLVQVKKEPLGTKGARVTTHFTIPGRWVVLLPDADYVAVSRKIESEQERLRLKNAGNQIRQPGDGLIIRTVAEGESEESLEKDLAILNGIWAGLLRRAEESVPPALLYRDLGMIHRLIRDLFSDSVDELVIDDGRSAQEIGALLSSFAPELKGRVRLFQEGGSVLKHYGIEEQLERAFRRKVWLANGGYLVVDITEALTVIDVNTGKYTGTVDLEQTVFETNLEAAEEIARLLRLRDIGGMIIADFIDMDEERHRRLVTERLESCMRKDRTKVQVVGWTKLGLVEITRKKVRPNLDELLTEPCPQCGGVGRLPSKQLPSLSQQRDT
ncbi:Rne/Rng family ribonuclease [Gorillibacterium sp. sgz5001074]|uniref:Rne/Rng family ribonuclease n=1 Tax=Gorillibacterium sp. sgz5001074 TaxID=3446695 RepID=UPI003F67185D